MELIIGLDCATRPSHVGLACAECTGRVVRVRELVLGAGVPDMPGQVAAWIAESERALVALDSPLGWPAGLGDALAAHRAGQPVGAAPDALFRRETDRSARERLGKQPLEVGADRIARTAVAALDLLAGIGAALGSAVPLAWDPDARPPVSAIEVYPAATLRSRGLQASRYRKPEQTGARREILGRIAPELDLRLVGERAISSDHLLDAVVCVLAGRDFLEGRCVGPTDRGVAAREGWIWAAGSE